MARVKREPAAPKPSDPLAPYDERIKKAEAQYVLATRKNIGVSIESVETLTELVEDGAGREPDVLREALALGLRAMKRARAGETVVEEPPLRPLEEQVEVDEVLRPQADLPLIVPPSQRRMTLGEIAENSLAKAVLG